MEKLKSYQILLELENKAHIKFALFLTDTNKSQQSLLLIV